MKHHRPTRWLFLVLLASGCASTQVPIDLRVRELAGEINPVAPGQPMDPLPSLPARFPPAPVVDTSTAATDRHLAPEASHLQQVSYVQDEPLPTGDGPG